MRQAITVKFINPTNHRGAHLKAIADAGSIIVPYDHELDHNERYKAAAEALCDKLGWSKLDLYGGWLAGGDVAVFVFLG